MNDEAIKRPSLLDEAEASVALDGDTHSVYDFPHVAFWDTCEEHLKHAREKHPFFADRVSASEKAHAFFAIKAAIEKERIKYEPSLENVLIGEVYEFLSEMARGDLDRAREEGADIVAVILRATEGDIKKEATK